MDVNEIQIGGTHYKREYQHWDWVCDIELHYLLGCSTKYISRWKEKNGLQDLRKSLHYIAKFEERGLVTNNYTQAQCVKIDLFADQHEPMEADIIRMICHGKLSDASLAIDKMIEENTSQEDIDKEVKQSYWRG